jgi:hypothetical protein
MKSIACFRIAAVLLLIFAAGHTFGFLTFRPATAEGAAVFESMQRVHFSVGSGQFVTAYLLFAAWLAWQLGGMARRNSSDARSLGLALLAVQIPSVVLSLMYFAAPPAVLSSLIGLCIAGGVLWAGTGAEESVRETGLTGQQRHPA